MQIPDVEVTFFALQLSKGGIVSPLICMASLPDGSVPSSRIVSQWFLES